MRLCPTEKETVELLSKVLNGNTLASEALAKVVHQDVAFTDPTLDSLEITIPHDILGIWVDPIGKERISCLCSCSFVLFSNLWGGGLRKIKIEYSLTLMVKFFKF